MAPTAPKASPQRFGDLKTRIVTAVAFAAVGLAMLYLGGVWAMLLIAGAAGAMAWEFRSVTLHHGGACGLDVALLMGGVVGAVVVAEFHSTPAAVFWLIWMLAGSAGADIFAGRPRAAVWGAIGGAYIGGAAIAFLYLREQEPLGFASVFWLFLVVAAADVGGYFAGRLIGGPKLWPRVSPAKTWAGLGGAVGLAIAVGAVFSLALKEVTLLPICAVSGTAAAISQAGDLAESAVKRHFGLKDSGRMMPGHGGALDRFDGLLAAALVAGPLTWWRGETVFIW